MIADATGPHPVKSPLPQLMIQSLQLLRQPTASSVRLSAMPAEGISLGQRSRQT